MIEKMMFVSLTGPINDIDRIADQYLSHYDIHLENPLTAMPNGHDLSPITQVNPYKELLGRAKAYTSSLPKNVADGTKHASVTLEDVKTLLDELDASSSTPSKGTSLKEDNAKMQELLCEKENLSHFTTLEFDLKSILEFKHIKVHFGRLPIESYERWDKHIKPDELMIFDKTSQDREYVWGAVAFPETESERMEALLISLRFESIPLKADHEGSPAKLLEELNQELKGIDSPSAAGESRIRPEDKAAELLGSVDLLEELSDSFDIRKKAGLTKLDDNEYFVLCGWMTKNDAHDLIHSMSNEKSILSVISKDAGNENLRPPTKLKNPKIFKPYEMYIGMYGLPNYNEFDPTIFVAVTYSFLFGAMYGDFGQGLCLLIGGLLLYKIKHINLAGIIALAGAFSTFFGLMFGSIFGFEDIIPALWLRPMEAMTTLPVIGRLNSVFVYAVMLGMGLILLTMVFHIVLAIRRHDKVDTLLGTNSLTGLVFYGIVVAMIVLFFSGHTIAGASIFIALIVISVLLMFLQEPLAHFMEKKKGPAIEGGVGMFIMQNFFELFEVMLSYFSNTLSFVRVGAFAVSHAAMMQVVLMLAGAESGNTNMIVVILGNLFVMGLEGLIVGIQVLRLEYYEMFSRFYTGDGHAFVSFFKKKKQ